MKRFLSLVIIVFITSSVIGATFVLIQTASTSNTSNIKMIEAFFGKTPDVASLAAVNLANAESAFAATTSPAMSVATTIWPTFKERPLSLTADIKLPVSTSASSWSTYFERSYDITMAYPATWQVRDDVSLGGSFELDSMDQALNEILSPGEAKIVVYRSEESVSSAMTEDTVGAVASYPASAVVAGTSVARLNAEFMDGADSQYVATVYVPHDGFLYRIILEYGGESRFANMFTQFLSSIMFASK